MLETIIRNLDYWFWLVVPTIMIVGVLAAVPSALLVGVVVAKGRATVRVPQPVTTRPTDA